MPKTGLLVIISAPSGGGKNAVISRLVKAFPNSSRLTTTTSRPPRQKEINGRDYFFISKQEFKQKIADNDMLEHIVYAGNYYGIEKSRLLNDLKKFSYVFTNIDIEGRKTINAAGIRAISIFLLPDDLETLADRIRRRGEGDEADLAARMKRAKEEVKQANLYDYQVINQDGKLGQTVKQVSQIIRTELKNRETKPTIDKKP